MGAIRLERGVAFRVWAPNAKAVSVIGSFNHWDISRARLAAENSGNWFGAVPEAKAGDEYLFAITTSSGEILKRIDPRARKVTNSVGNGIIWWPEISPPPEPFPVPTQNELVIYELHIGSYHATRGQGPGTFASAQEKLPYLRELGINAVEVMPIAEFAGDFSWGYNPAHPFAVESAYGGPEGFLDFVQAAHAHGIAVILDVVYNHFGPSDLSLWQFDGWKENDGGGIYFYNDWKASTPWGSTRPDYGRAEVRSYIHDNALMWLRDFHVDGLRMDMSIFIRTVHGKHGDPGNDLADGWSLLQWINDDIRREFPRAITIAEDLRDSDWLVKTPGTGGAGFSSQWAGEFVHPVRTAMIVQDDAQRSLDSLVGAISFRYDTDAFKRVIYSESHDEVANGKARLPSEISPEHADSYFARKRSILGAALTLTAPGIPMLFQGQEFLEDKWFRDEVPVDWAKLGKFAGVHALYRDLVALRVNRGGHTAGLTGQHVHAHHVNHGRQILGFRRWKEGGAGDDVIVLMNLSHETVADHAIGVPAAGLWHVRLNSDSRAYSTDFGDQPVFDGNAKAEPYDGMEFKLLASLAPYSFVIFSQDRA
ncbi:MAG: 1,4-alpha-glucan branching protein [Verrucomicrobia bacterium]|nr:1,4-alpha-glucan branching protein [Verrucomicrobiota bacterium]